MNNEVLKSMFARLARWGAVALITHALNKGWLAPAEADQATTVLAQLLLEFVLVMAAALTAGWLAVREKLHLDRKRIIERQRTQIALTLSAGATLTDVESIRQRIAQQQSEGRVYDTQP